MPSSSPKGAIVFLDTLLQIWESSPIRSHKPSVILFSMLSKSGRLVFQRSIALSAFLADFGHRNLNINSRCRGPSLATQFCFLAAAWATMRASFLKSVTLFGWYPP